MKAHSDCGWTCGWADKTVRSLENTTCHTWALPGLWFMKRRYIKCTYLYLCVCIDRNWWSRRRQKFGGAQSPSATAVVCVHQQLVHDQLVPRRPATGAALAGRPGRSQHWRRKRRRRGGGGRRWWWHDEEVGHDGRKGSAVAESSGQQCQGRRRTTHRGRHDEDRGRSGRLCPPPDGHRHVSLLCFHAVARR